MAIILAKKERSTELNSLKRILIDFKSLVNDGTFKVYKSNGLIYYIFDDNGFFTVTKRSKFLFLDDFLEENEYIAINYKELKRIVDLKKAEVTNIYYDTDEYCFETTIDEVEERYIITKEEDTINTLANIINMYSPDMLSENFISAEYNVKEQILYSKEDSTPYPYKITFSDDINFKLNIDNPESEYYLRALNEGAFTQVITISKYKEVFDAQSMLFVFNYLNNKE